jgi:DNA-directed RNA polymerase specialized sigma subunit
MRSKQFKIDTDDDDIAPKKRTVDPKYHARIWAKTGKLRTPRLTRSEEFDLIAAAKGGCQVSATKLSKSFSQFLTGIADVVSTDSNCPHLKEDMQAIGFMTLHETIQRFDLSRDARLSNLLRYKSETAMHEHALRFAHPFVTGRGSDERKAIYQKQKYLNKVRQIHNRVFDGSAKDYVLMSQITEISSKALKRGFEAGKIETVPVSNIVIVSSEDHAELSVLKQDRDQFLAKTVSALREDLSPRNRDIFDTLSNPEAPSLVTLGTKHKISPVRVGQIYRTCTQTLRKNLARNGIHARSDLA